MKEQEVFPGLIDIHTHGCMGVDAMDNQPEDLSRIYAGMAPLHHRTPGVIGAAMDKNIYAQVICDGLHVHPAVVRMLYKVFGPQRLILISDSMRACGLHSGKYDLVACLLQLKTSRPGLKMALWPVVLPH